MLTTSIRIFCMILMVMILGGYVHYASEKIPALLNPEFLHRSRRVTDASCQ